MSPNVIVSYDDTATDRDAVALGRIFADAGADLALAYVRHFPGADGARELAEAEKARDLLERGAVSIGAEQAERHVVVNASTPDGLRDLATREGAELIVFGSEYRTPRGRVAPGTSARRLLQGGPVAVAIAPAGLQERAGAIQRIGILAGVEDQASEQTAHSLADALGAHIAAEGERELDLLVVGSRPEAAHGRVTLSAAAEYAVESASCPVLVVPRNVAVRFRARRLVPA